MDSKRNFHYFLRNLTVKHRLSYRNQHNDTEVWYMYISPLKIIAGLLALVLVLFIVVLTTVAYTPVLDLVPGYPGNKSRELLMKNIIRLDSMERELNNLQIYSDNVSLIMDGKAPVMRTVARGADTSHMARGEIVAPSQMDSVLRSQMEGDGPYALSATVSSDGGKRAPDNSVAPLKGVIAAEFSPRDGLFGVGIAAAAGQEVVAVDDGTVVSSLWSPDQGYVVQIQHSDNLITVYRNLSRVVAGQGARVRAREVIGYSGDREQAHLFFELWHNGTPVDPRGYIVF